MNCKKILMTTVGAAVVGAGMGGKKGLEKGLGLGVKIGFISGVTAVLVGSTAVLVGKNKIKRKYLLNPGQ